MLTAAVHKLEDFLFRNRGAVLAVFAVLTVLMGWEASKLRIDRSNDLVGGEVAFELHSDRRT